MPVSTVYLALGANLGHREHTLRAAIAEFHPAGIHLLKLSSFYETEPQGFAGQPWFLNAVAAAQTALPPLDLLNQLHAIERRFGRARDAEHLRNGPRTLDLDLLLYANQEIRTPELEVPHPRMLTRRFVLEPLLEIAPTVLLPNGEPIAPYLENTRDQSLRKFQHGYGSVP